MSREIPEEIPITLINKIRSGYQYSHEDVINSLNSEKYAYHSISQTRPLEKGPNISFLRQIVFLPNEVLIFRAADQWFAKGGTSRRVLTDVFMNTTIRIHSHLEEDRLPSPTDLYFALRRGKNFIAGPEGLTFYTDPKKNPAASLLRKAQADFSDEELRAIEKSQPTIKDLVFTAPGDTRDDFKYEEYLRDAGVTYRFTHWDDLSDDRLNEFFR